VEAEPSSEGSRIPLSLTSGQVLQSWPFSSEPHVNRGSLEPVADHHTCNANRRGTVPGASRVWHTNNLAPNLRSGTRSTRHAECNVPPFGRAPQLHRSRPVFYACTVVCRCSPSRSTPNLTTWPGRKKTGGFIPIPTPGGVPVAITSPGCRVMIRLK
jgi:hypothetical protein